MPVTTLNFLPTTFSTNQISAFTLTYNDQDQFRNLQDRYKGHYLMHRDSNLIRAIQLIASPKPLPKDATTTSISCEENHHIFSMLLEEGIRRYLRSSNPSISEYGRIQVRVEKENEDLIPLAIKRAFRVQSECNEALKKCGFLHIYRRYYIEAAYVGVTTNMSPKYGLLFDIGTSWQIKASINELVSKGIDVKGCYITPINKPIRPNQIGHHSVGRISRISNDLIYLTDFRDVETVSSRTHQIEGSLDNFTLCINSLLGEVKAKTLLQEIRRSVYNVTSAHGQQDRIQKLAAAFAKQPITCAYGLTAKFSSQLVDTSEYPGTRTFVMSAPSYSLGYTKPPVTTSIASAIAKTGPFDQDSFAKVIPQVLVITPKSSQGAVEQFLRQWRNGISDTSYSKGFVTQYRLRGCDFRVEGVEDGTSIAEQYLNACNRGITYSQEKVKRFDLAFVVVERKHRLLGRDDPYLICKAALMGREIPVQVIELETIRSSAFSIPFILNNLALACYAKLGGTPWALASTHGQGITHELIVGLGSVTISDGRFQDKERYVGITTLFNYDGVYLLSNVSEDVGYAQYPQALQTTLLNSIQYISIKKGWQRGDKVRLIFHTFKPLKHVEMDAVKSTISQALADYTVDFAFLTISQYHSWSMYNPNYSGLPIKSGSSVLKGKGVPSRGTTLLIGPKKSLLAMTGPSEIKTADQGCPQPLLLTLHRASTFLDLEYLTRQVFDFSYMSWKTYNLSSMPVTIQYSELIAELLGRLRQVRNWNSNVLQSGTLKTSLWFL